MNIPGPWVGTQFPFKILFLLKIRLNLVSITSPGKQAACFPRWTAGVDGAAPLRPPHPPAGKVTVFFPQPSTHLPVSVLCLEKQHGLRDSPCPESVCPVVWQKGHTRKNNYHR